MSDVLAFIQKRRSIRRYTDEPVSDEQVETLLRAAMAAPSAAVENLLLAAANMGLGTCWCGVHPQPDREAGFRELCRLPDHVVPLAVIAVGVPDEEKGPADYYDPERVHPEEW